MSACLTFWTSHGEVLVRRVALGRRAMGRCRPGGTGPRRADWSIHARLNQVDPPLEAGVVVLVSVLAGRTCVQLRHGTTSLLMIAPEWVGRH